MGSLALTAPHLFVLLLLAEGVWVALYALAAMLGSAVDEAGCFGLTFYILGLASIELSAGLLLLIVLRRLKIALSLCRNTKGGGALLGRALAPALRVKGRF